MTAFHEILFPLDIALRSAGGPQRRTDVVTLGSGAEERNARWAHSRRRYDAYGVNSGIGRSGKVLRRVLGLPDNTSVVTDEVVAATRAIDPRTLITAICDERMHFLQSLKTWPVFGRGWSRRVAEVKSKALEMASDAAKPGALSSK